MQGSRKPTAAACRRRDGSPAIVACCRRAREGSTATASLTAQEMEARPPPRRTAGDQPLTRARLPSPRTPEQSPSPGFSTEPSHTPEPPPSPRFSPEPPPSPRMSELRAAHAGAVAVAVHAATVACRRLNMTVLGEGMGLGPYPFIQGYNSKLIFHKSFFYFYLYFFNPKPWDPSIGCQK
ncbi:hypothetical protein [Oryza sativa Japonica Group]|uniref:Uncharacterized protein n=1 Tax=Oryza sativa subsp. japonica TaxID=39947 RepID=Q5JKP2_ORYSJ|nr:hypothetical protein [Oryza sativa Japonica Group]BAD87965.1 hypothetical protein [Oryza sativa Japonica Group]